MYCGKNYINSHLWYGAEQLVCAHVSVATWFKAAACKFVISLVEVSQEDLVVMVGVEEAAHITSKLVKLGQPHPLLITTASFVVFTFFMVQLRKKED